MERYSYNTWILIVRHFSFKLIFIYLRYLLKSCIEVQWLLCEKFISYHVKNIYIWK